MKLYVDDEPLILGTADLERYERSLDFRDGVLRRSLVWRTPSGKRVQVESTRMVSMTERHLALMSLEVTMLEGDAPIVISSQLLNRQDGTRRVPRPGRRDGRGRRPPQGGHLRGPGAAAAPALRPASERMELGYSCANSRMTIAVAADHTLTTEDPQRDRAQRTSRTWPRWSSASRPREGSPVRLHKAVAYHTSRGVPVRELADRCDRTLDRARHHGAGALPRRAARLVRRLLVARRRRGRPRTTPPARARSPSSRRSGSTCSPWPRPAPAPTSRACPPRASPGRATRGTTSGTPRSTSRRS